MKKERAIKFAKDRNSGELLDADIKFRSTKEAHLIREQYNSGVLELLCCECGQPLHISKSVYERVYFKHAPYADYCVLKDGNFSAGDMDLIRKAAYARESDRHKYLKYTIANLLGNTSGIELQSISADTKFLFSDDGKRRPDVYCRYYEKELVFEIQLSPLPQRYLLDRHNFYKEKGIYLIWILDDFDVHGQSSTEKDIKYLNTFQNFFTLDEQSATKGTFKLLCDYKEPVIYKERSILTPWKKKSVSLEEIQYCTSTYQIYYLDFEQVLILKNEELRQIEEVVRQEQKRLEIEEIKARKRSNADQLIAKIKRHKDNGRAFYTFSEEYAHLYDLDHTYLNEKLAFTTYKHNGKTLLNHYIASASTFQQSFIRFLLSDKIIKIDVNLTNDDGTTSFQEIYKSKFLYKGELVRLLFERGYRLIDEDRDFFNLIEEKREEDKIEELFLLECMDRLIDKELVEQVWRRSRLLCILESAKRQEMVTFKYKNWISLGILAITSYKQYWEYIEAAFKNYGIWEVLIGTDKKGTFQRKLTEFYQTMPEQDYSADELISELYEELG